MSTWLVVGESTHSLNKPLQRCHSSNTGTGRLGNGSPRSSHTAHGAPPRRFPILRSRSDSVGRFVVENHTKTHHGTAHTAEVARFGHAPAKAGPQPRQVHVVRAGDGQWWSLCDWTAVMAVYVCGCQRCRLNTLGCQHAPNRSLTCMAPIQIQQPPIAPAVGCCLHDDYAAGGLGGSQPGALRVP